MKQSLGFENLKYPLYVCKLNKIIYELKQTPRAWSQCFSSFFTTQGFTSSHMFVYKHGSHMAMVLLYVDQIILTASSSNLLNSFLVNLEK